VVSEYEAECRAYAVVCAEYEAACQRYYAECPERDEEFKAYGLSGFETRKSGDDLRKHVEIAIIVAEYRGKKLSPSDYGAIAERAARILDDFRDYHTKKSAAFERLVSAEERKHDKAVDARSTAYAKMLDTPAPDAAAIAFKLNAVATYACEADDVPYGDLKTIIADANRLLKVA
jgi:hypothetical protein